MGITVQHDVSLKAFNTFHVDAQAAAYVELRKEDQVEIVFEHAISMNWPVLVLGGGSNLLFTQDFDGLVVHNQLLGIKLINETSSDVFVEAGAGVNWHELVMYCVGKGWGGLENLSLIPGTVGAAPVQNIGAYGVELKDSFYSLRAWDRLQKKVINLSASQCDFGYRQSIFKKDFKDRMLILSVSFRLSKYPELQLEYGSIRSWLKQHQVKNPTIKDVSAAVISIRKSKLPDPAHIGNAGSFFKNPEVSASFFEALKALYPDLVAFPFGTGYKLAAGWLIEQCGWKGFRSGDAGCHAQQALVLVNYGTARGSEIVQLAEKIQQSVTEKFGVSLTPEVNII
jgi:UDP-N-acetylmuramate dehydrogenase